jgi:hypothetical protein
MHRHPAVGRVLSQAATNYQYAGDPQKLGTMPRVRSAYQLSDKSASMSARRNPDVRCAFKRALATRVPRTRHIPSQDDVGVGSHNAPMT